MSPVIKKQCEDFYSANRVAVDSLASYLSVPAMWLVCLFYNESALHPLAQNSITGAAGLNQMMPATLANLGSSTSEFLNSGIAGQCELMKKFFEPIRGIIKRPGDLYLFNFLPQAVITNVSANYVLGERNNYDKFYGLSKNQIYLQNKSLDFNSDGLITRSDFWDGFEAKYDELLKGNSFFFRDLWIDFKTNAVSWILVLIAFISIIVITYNYFS